MTGAPSSRRLKRGLSDGDISTFRTPVSLAKAVEVPILTNSTMTESDRKWKASTSCWTRRTRNQTHVEKKAARRQFLELGRQYPETQEFQKIPGIGPISAHTFDALIQTPCRFATKQKLWRYSKLGIQKRSSGGNQIQREKLDSAGHGELKALSHRAVKEALGGEDENEVQASYRASARRTGEETHARLNTQRKILATMWGLWKRSAAYNPKLFYRSKRTRKPESSG